MKKFIGVTLVCVAVPAAVLHAGRGQWRNLGLTAFVVAVAPSDPGVVYAGSADAVWRSEDSGRTWVHTGFRGNEVVSLVVNPADPQSVFVSSVLPGDQGAVLSKTEDGGVTWEAVLAQPFGTFLDLAIPASEPDWMYLRWSDSNFFLKAYVGNILKSENGGLNWADMGPAASIDPRQYWVGSLAVDPENPSLLYIESALGFMKSLDGGVSWTRIGPGPPTGQDGVLLATPGDPSGFLYACGITSQPSGVFRSLDGGETWAATSVTVQADTIIAGPLAGTVFAGTVEGIFVSGDSGSTWTRMTPPLDVAIDSFAFGGSALYAATEAGLYVLSTIPVRDFPKTPPAPILHPTRIGAFRSVK